MRSIALEFIKPVKFKTDEKIDFEVLKTEIQQHGPFKTRQGGNPYQIIMNISPCGCPSPTCNTDVITIIRICGLSEIKWSVDKDMLLSFDCLDDFFRWCQIQGPVSSSGERQVIEQHIHNFLGSDYSGVDKPFCACSACAAMLEKHDLWKNHLLRSLALHLQELDALRAELEDDERDYWQYVFDQGYALGRLVGEYHLKSQVEELAQRGIAADEAITTRTAASGKSSSKKRQLRIQQMLEEMERLVSNSPALLRLPQEEIAGLAIEDAAASAPDLWSQGTGQKREYLDEMKADLRYRDRFLALFKTA